MSGEGAPARADLQHARALADATLLERPVEFPLERRRQRLVVVLVHALAIGGKDRIEEAQEQLRVGVVVGGDGPLVGIDLSEQQRLDEAPGRDQRVPVVERGAEIEGLHHVAFEVDVALQIGLGDISLVEGAQRPQRTLVAQAHFELGLALAECPLLAVGQLDGKGRRDLAHAVEQGVDRRCGCRHSAIPRLGQAPAAGQRHGPINVRRRF